MTDHIFEKEPLLEKFGSRVGFISWKPITEAPKDKPLWLFSPDFVDKDFNPSGVVDGFWNDDAGWVIWKWNGYHDCYDTVSYVTPTHFASKEDMMKNLVKVESLVLTNSEIKEVHSNPDVLRSVANYHSVQATMADALGPEWNKCVNHHDKRQKELLDEANRIEETWDYWG